MCNRPCLPFVSLRIQQCPPLGAGGINTGNPHDAESLWLALALLLLKSKSPVSIGLRPRLIGSMLLELRCRRCGAGIKLRTTLEAL